MLLQQLLRRVAVVLILASPVLLQSGCGGGDDVGVQLNAQEDTTLNPETDSTMMSGTSTVAR